MTSCRSAGRKDCQVRAIVKLTAMLNCLKRACVPGRNFFLSVLCIFKGIFRPISLNLKPESRKNKQTKRWVGLMALVVFTHWAGVGKGRLGFEALGVKAG